MWDIAGHEIVLTGSHVDPSYWSAAFVLRCYHCPGDGSEHADTPVWSVSEHHYATDPEFDFDEAIRAVIDHTGPVTTNGAAEAEAATFMAKLSRRLEPGLALLADASTDSAGLA
jgi:hypothetical protein